jgi:formylglycine-generating enzyme required for sulfatase activity
MGCDSGRPDESPVHTAEVGSFALGRTPVTNAQYAAFVAEAHGPQAPFLRQSAFADPDLPVVGVTWFEAVAFAEWLGGRYGGRWRLPTEAEWERAMRGGLEGALTAWGDAVPAGEVPEGPLEGPWPVGRGTPNGFGLLDPGTVVHEWCADVYGPYAAWDARRGVAGPGTDSGALGSLVLEPGESPDEGAREGRRPETVALRRSSRGGSWRHRQRWSPPAARSSLPPDLRYADYGFRVLREED